MGTNWYMTTCDGETEHLGKSYGANRLAVEGAGRHRLGYIIPKAPDLDPDLPAIRHVTAWLHQGVVACSPIADIHDEYGNPTSWYNWLTIVRDAYNYELLEVSEHDNFC